MIGKIISHYKILNKLGAGGMGDVYLAEDTELDRKVALKFLMTHCTADTEVKSRFEREAKAAAALNHPNIITVYEIGEHEGRTYIAMEYVEGESLRQKANSGQLSVDSAVDIVTQTCNGLNAAHQAGIIHRDIKPENIIIDKSGRVRILDFGLARMAGVTRLTKEASTLGTISYMSPEQFQGASVDQRADVWAVGVVLYEMLTGELPFQGDYEQAVMYSVCNEEPPPISDLRLDLPANADTVICKALEKDQTKRYRNMQELLQDLQALTVSPTAAPKQEKSIVVLPFENMSPDPDQEYFSDGLTEEIITDLSQIHDLLVISRSSAMTFKGTKKKIREIAKEVNVRYVLEGSVRKAGNNLRITAQLIDAANDSHLWAEKYKGTLDDIFDIQEKVSRSIVDALKLKLSPEENKAIAERRIDNVPAYECYLKAYREIWKCTEDALNRALKYLENSLKIIGDNALLYSGMALAYWNLVNIGIRQEDYLVRAEECVKKALTVNSEYPKALAVLGLIDLLRGNPREVVYHLKQALTINPDETVALLQIAAVYEYAGKVSAAVPFCERLVQIDPLDFGTAWHQGGQHFYAGRYDDALQGWRRLYEVYPENPYSQFSYALILSYHNQLNEAFRIIDHSAKVNPNNVLTKLGLVLKYGLQGEKERAFQEMTPDFRKTCQRDPTYSHHLAGIFALLNEKDEAFNWLEIAVDRGFLNYPLLAERDPFLENIRGEERFKKLMERVKVEWENFEV